MAWWEDVNFFSAVYHDHFCGCLFLLLLLSLYKIIQTKRKYSAYEWDKQIKKSYLFPL